MKPLPRLAIRGYSYAMRIVIATGIYPPEVGGPATFSRNLAEELLAKAHETVIVTYGDQKTQRSPGLVHVISRGSWVIARYIRYAIVVYKEARKSHSVFAQGPVSEGVPACIAAYAARRPLFLKVVGDVAWESAQRSGYAASLESFLATPPKQIKAFLMRTAQRCVARHAVQVIVPSRYLQSVVRQWGVDSSRITVVYNAVEMGASDIDPEVLRKEYNLEGKRVLLTGGRFVPWKRVDMLLEALPRLSKEVVLVIAGSGPLLKAWQRLVVTLGVEDRVRWLGNCSRDRLASWYRLAEGFLLPSLYEGLPHMVLEAAAHGCPSLVSPHGGNPETVDLCGELVRVVSDDTVDGWVGAIKTLIDAEKPCLSAKSSHAPWTKSDQMEAYLRLLSITKPPPSAV